MAARGTDDWEELLPWLQAAINATISRTIGYSPHEVLFGEPPSPLMPLDDLPPVPLTSAPQPVEDFMQALRRRLAAIRTRAQEAQAKARQQAADDYYLTPLAGRQYGGEQQMAQKRPFGELEKGTLVAVKKPKVAHFDLGAAGPYLVEEDLGDSARVRGMNGRVTTHNKANIVVLKAQFPRKGG